jgi:tyrosinase
VFYIVQNQQRLFNLFSNYNNYTIFSNEGWAADTTSYDSLESLHDNIHAELGGSEGHMTIVPFSAFDPLFFLHHCNVDRIFAIWQALHPDSWIVPEVARMNSYTTSLGQLLDSTSALTPFYRNSDGDFWTSDMLRDTVALGYTYGELANSGISLTNTTSILNGQAQLASIVNRLYGGYSVNSLKIQSKRADRRGNPIRHGRDQEGWYMGRGRRSTASLPVTKIISEQGKYQEWIANVRVVRQALDGPFSVNLDLGGPDTSNLYVGSMSVFASPPSIASLKKLAPGAEYIAGTVPLTAALVDKVADGTLASMEHGEVEQYLREYLSTRVVRADGAEVDPAGVAGLRIEVVSWPVQTTANEEQLPTWGEADYKIRIM